MDYLEKTQQGKSKQAREILSKSFINKYSFYNPIMQNQTHIEALKKLIKTSVPTVNLVVFSNQALLKDVKTNYVLIKFFHNTSMIKC